MTSTKDPNEKVTKTEAELWNKIYSKMPTTQTPKKERYKPLGSQHNTVQKTEADLWNKLYKSIAPSGKSASGFYGLILTVKTFLVSMNTKTVLLSLVVIIAVGLSLFFIWGGGLSYTHLLRVGGVSYTKNPSNKEIPMQAVVKIIVNDEQTGSGIVFTKEGHILTNAHVLTSPLGRNAKSIEVCYSGKDYRDVHCDYEATIVDIDRGEDLAVIKTTKKIAEVTPYLFVVEENEESFAKEIVPLGTQVSVVGFPGVGGESVTMTKGIVSGYKNGEIVYDDGSFQKIPYYLKTDSEINFGNSGGAAFDDANRYIGIPSVINKDDGGKIGYIIYWNKINLFLNHLVYDGKLSLPAKQYAKRIILPTETDLWDGIRSYFREDYKPSIDKLKKYTGNHPSDSRGITYLCNSYLELEDWANLESCSGQLRTANPDAQALGWALLSYYYVGKDNNMEKAYENINKALSIQPDFITLLTTKAFLEVNLNRFADAKKTAEKVLTINEIDPDAIEILGRVALEDGDYDNGFKYLEWSFEQKPSARTADILSGYYMLKYQQDKITEDLGRSLIYRVGSVVLDQKNIDYLISLADNIVYIFEEDPGTWGESLEKIKSLVEIFEVDRELIEPILSISDDEIRTYLSNNSTHIQQKDIDATRYYVKLSVAWLYTLIGEKNACNSMFQNIMGSEMWTIFSDLGKTQKEITQIAKRSIALQCLCENTDYSSDVLRTCMVRKASTLK